MALSEKDHYHLVIFDILDDEGLRAYWKHFFWGKSFLNGKITIINFAMHN